MPKKCQTTSIKLQRERLIKELNLIYKSAFSRICELELSEGALVKLSQVILQSKEGAIAPLSKEIEKPIITSAPNEVKNIRKDEGK